MVAPWACGCKRDDARAQDPVGLADLPGAVSHELPSADPSLLPAMREQGGELSRSFVDVFVGFRLCFHDEREAFGFAQHFRFASPRSALRQEGAGVVWVGFHGWAFDGGDAQMQAALAVRHSAIKAKVRHIPAATDAEMRPTGRRLLNPQKAREERDELLAKIDEAVPHMYDTRRTALGGASAKPKQIGSGGVAPVGAPAPAPAKASAAPSQHATSKAPPGFDAAGAGAQGAKRRRLFGR
jgi:hypothetical protein